jgi:hypothetical protein
MLLPVNEHNRAIPGLAIPGPVPGIGKGTDAPLTPKRDPLPTTPRKISAAPLVVPTWEEVQKEESKIKHLLKATESLDPNESNTRQIVDQMAPGVIEEIIHEGSRKNVLDFSPQSISPPIIEEGFINGNPGLEIGVVGLNIVSRASSAIVLKLLLNKIEDAIEAKKELLKYGNGEGNDILENQITILTHWADVHSALVAETLKESVMETTFSLPKAASGIVMLAHAAETIIATVVDWIGIGIGLISSTFCLYLRKKDFDEHEKWASLINDEGKSADEIYRRQKEIFDYRKEENLPKLNQLLESVHRDVEAADDKERVIENVLERLREVGIEFSEEITTVAALEKALSDHDALNTMMVKKKEMLSVSLRNALKVFNRKKNEIDRGFLDNAMGKAALCFSYSLNLTLASIVLQSLIYTGVIAATSALTVFGYGAIVLLLGFLGLGGYYLHSKKPNIFKTYVKGVQAKLAFWSIPLAIQQFRKNYALLENVKAAEEIKAIWHRINLIDRLLPNSDINGLQNLKEELIAAAEKKSEELKYLNGKINGLSESINSLEERIKPLQEQIEEAGKKDFLFQLNGEVALDSDTMIELSNLNMRSKTSKEGFRILAESIMLDPTLREDKQTRKILLHKGIDLSESTIDEVENKIRAFFAMETEDTLKFIEGQKLLEENGLQENTANS